MKHSLEEFKISIGMTEKRIGEFDNRSISTVQLRNWKIKGWRKLTGLERAKGEHQLYQCTHNGRLRRRGKEGQRNIWINNGQKLYKFDETINLHIQEAQQTPVA